MLRDNISLNDVIISFESTLKIEHNQPDAGKLKLEARQRIESIFQIQINSDIYELQANKLTADSVNQFLGQITECLKSMSLLVQISIFDKRISENLYDVNYLGFAKGNLLTALKYLQDSALYEKRGSFMSDLVRGVSRIETSKIKRLLVILIILEDLGIKEGVAIIASYLYLGSI